jgi:hypothetical protein
MVNSNLTSQQDKLRSGITACGALGKGTDHGRDIFSRHRSYYTTGHGRRILRSLR